MYGFAKVRTDDKSHLYSHPKFRRGHQQLIKTIERKIPPQTVEEESNEIKIPQ